MYIAREQLESSVLCARGLSQQQPSCRGITRPALLSIPSARETFNAFTGDIDIAVDHGSFL